MKKITFMVIGILLVIGLVGAGTFAYFSDTEETTENVIQAGTIDLELRVDEEVSGAFTFIDILPGAVLDPMVIKLANVGQNNGYLYQGIAYVEVADEDQGEGTADLTADEFAALIYVESIWYQHLIPDESYVGELRDDMADLDAIDAAFNNDGYCSLYEMGKVGWMPYSIDEPEDALDAGHIATYTITFGMADSLNGHVWGDASEPTEAILEDVVDNEPQGDGIQITWTAILKQNPGMPE